MRVHQLQPSALDQALSSPFLSVRVEHRSFKSEGGGLCHFTAFLSVPGGEIAVPVTVCSSVHFDDENDRGIPACYVSVFDVTERKHVDAIVHVLKTMGAIPKIAKTIYCGAQHASEETNEKENEMNTEQTQKEEKLYSLYAILGSNARGGWSAPRSATWVDFVIETPDSRIVRCYAEIGAHGDRKWITITPEVKGLDVQAIAKVLKENNLIQEDVFVNREYVANRHETKSSAAGLRESIQKSFMDLRESYRQLYTAPDITPADIAELRSVINQQMSILMSFASAGPVPAPAFGYGNPSFGFGPGPGMSAPPVPDYPFGTNPWNPRR